MADSKSNARPQVLIVDDDKDIREGLAEVLQATLPVGVTVAESSAHGLEVLARERVDLILSDFRMEGMDGCTFLRRAQELYPRTPRIMISAYGTPALLDRVRREVDLIEFVAKPINPFHLVGLVAQALKVGKSGN